MGTLNGLLQDLRIAIRTLAKNRVFSFSAIATLVLGIGATTVMFSVVYSLRFEPFIYKDSERLVMFTVDDLGKNGFNRSWLYIPEFAAVREQNKSFEDLVGYRPAELAYRNNSGTRNILGGLVTVNSFEFLAVRPLLGRGIQPADGEPDAEPVFVMNYGMWKRDFGSDPGILGKTFTLNNRPRTLVGIMPPEFQFVSGAEVWLPLSLRPGAEGQLNVANLPIGLMPIGVPSRRYSPHCRGRPKFRLLSSCKTPGSATLPSLPGKFHRYDRNSPRSPDWKVQGDALYPSRRRDRAPPHRVHQRVEPFACSGYEAQTGDRDPFCHRREPQSACPATHRGEFGNLFCRLCSRLDSRIRRFESGSRRHSSRCDSAGDCTSFHPAVLLFSLFVASVTTILCGLAPALFAIHGELYSHLAAGSKNSDGGYARGKLRAGLIIAEVALSVILLAGAGLMTRTLLALTHVDVGFDSNRLLYAKITLPKEKYAADQKKMFFRELIDRVTTIPGVVAAGTTTMLPTTGGAFPNIRVRGSESSELRNGMWDLASPELLSDNELAIGSRENTLGERHRVRARCGHCQPDPRPGIFRRR